MSFSTLKAIDYEECANGWLVFTTPAMGKVLSKCLFSEGRTELGVGWWMKGGMADNGEIEVGRDVKREGQGLQREGKSKYQPAGFLITYRDLSNEISLFLSPPPPVRVSVLCIGLNDNRKHKAGLLEGCCLFVNLLTVSISPLSPHPTFRVKVAGASDVWTLLKSLCLLVKWELV